jgi:hypothetical protein
MNLIFLKVIFPYLGIFSHEILIIFRNFEVYSVILEHIFKIFRVIYVTFIIKILMLKFDFIIIVFLFFALYSFLFGYSVCFQYFSNFYYIFIDCQKFIYFYYRIFS